MALILSGKKIASEIKGEVKARIEETAAKPTLAAVIFGDDEGSLIYARSKARAADKIGINVEILQFSADIRTEEAVSIMTGISGNKAYHGIILEEPLPENIDPFPVREAINPAKDVDCTTAGNIGRIISGEPVFLPATPLAILEILKKYRIDTNGKRAVIVGRSRTVGLPLANMLLRKSPEGNATVTVCHSRTRDLSKITKSAEILIVAIGKPGFVNRDHVSKDAVVIDVGTNYIDGKLIGDVDHDSVEPVAGSLTPVPGGVGPVTVSCLLRNAYKAYRLSREM